MLQAAIGSMWKLSEAGQYEDLSQTCQARGFYTRQRDNAGMRKAACKYSFAIP